MVHVGPYAGRNLFQQKPASVALITVGMGGGSSLPVCADRPAPPQSRLFQEFAQAVSCSSLLSLSFGAV